jgi:hypothetical protein
MSRPRETGSSRISDSNLYLAHPPGLSAKRQTRIEQTAPAPTMPPTALRIGFRLDGLGLKLRKPPSSA